MSQPTRSGSDAKFASGDELLETKLASRYLKVSPRTMERWRVNGTSPPYSKLGPSKKAKVVYRRSDLDAWLARYGGFTSTAQYGDRGGNGARAQGGEALPARDGQDGG